MKTIFALICGLIFLPSMALAQQAIVGGGIKRVCVEPVADLAAYAAGDSLSPVLTFSDVVRCPRVGDTHCPRSGHIVAVTVANVVPHSIDMVAIPLTADPTSSTLTANAPLVIHDDDKDKMLPIIAITSHDTFSASSISQSIDKIVPIELPTDDLYMAIEVGGVIDLAAADDMQVCVIVDFD